MDKFGQLIMAVFGGIITLAIVAVVVSRKAQTPAVIQAASSALANVVGAAVNPIVQRNGSGNIGHNAFSLPNLSGFGIDTSQFLKGLDQSGIILN